ncbi:MAG: hypothetical protein JO307_24715 [Bryobacterales bacterium]|nr:hypothetical protein [Bryobacterales bacterium]
MSIQSLWRNARESFTRVRDHFRQSDVVRKIFVVAATAFTAVPVGFAVHAAVHGSYGYATAFAGVAVWNLSNTRYHLGRFAARAAAHNRPHI